MNTETETHEVNEVSYLEKLRISRETGKPVTQVDREIRAANAEPETINTTLRDGRDDVARARAALAEAESKFQAGVTLQTEYDRKREHEAKLVEHIATADGQLASVKQMRTDLESSLGLAIGEPHAGLASVFAITSKIATCKDAEVAIPPWIKARRAELAELRAEIKAFEKQHGIGK
jgi:outer membrane protein TolC